MFDWSKNPVPVYLIICSDGRSFSNIDIVKKRQLLNISFSTALPCTQFLPILHYVVAYARPFKEYYSVPFKYVIILGFRKDLEFANFIRSASASTYDH